MALARSYSEKLEKHIADGKQFIIWSKSNAFPLFFDQIIRWAVLLIFKQGYLNNIWFVIIQVLFIPILIIVILIFLNNRVKKKFEGKIKTISITAMPNKSVGILLTIFIILSWFVISNVLIDLHISNWFLKFIIQVIIFLIFAFYQFFITSLSHTADVSDIHFYPEGTNTYYCCKIETFDKYNGSNVSGKLTEKDIETQEIDKNDLEIAELDSEVLNMLNRTEAYTLESIFIGALSFSGFLAIASSDKIQENLDAFTNLSTKLSTLLNNVLQFKFNEYLINFNFLTSGWSLFALIAIQCLICSMFFILVLASRIRFSNLIEKLYSLLKIAQLYNSKEEELHLLELQKISGLDHRLNYLKSKVEASLSDTRKILNKARPLYAFMSIFRNLGIISFYLILITSGLFFSTSISLSIIAILIFGFTFKSVLGILDNRKINDIINKHRK